VNLKQKLIRDIGDNGPMSVADYVWRCLFDPKYGYYSTQPAIGADGDFITAPMVSQMFGEMIGLWVVSTWQALGQPSKYYLVEIGGGDGTLYADINKVLHKFNACFAATNAILIDASKPLQMLQREKNSRATIFDTLSDIPTDAPLIVIANEVLDCLPARQYIKTADGFVERCIGLDHQKNLSFGLIPVHPDFAAPQDVPTHQMIEISPAQMAFTQTLGDTLKVASGAALLIDYGHDGPAFGDTLQALYRHKKTDPLDNPGAHDLTQWADFPTVMNTAHMNGVFASRLVTQSEFLQNMGIVARFKALVAQNPARSEELQRQLQRLIHPDEMGTLFKAVCLYYPQTVPMIGF
jgi:SAM-dependent MidA family methyltransferase